MRRLLRSLAVFATAFGLALAMLGAAGVACPEQAMTQVTEAAAAHDCDGGSTPAPPARHHDCTMLAASCAPAILAEVVRTSAAAPVTATVLPRAHDDAQPDDADRGPTPPPPRA